MTRGNQVSNCWEVGSGQPYKEAFQAILLSYSWMLFLRSLQPF